MIQEHRFNVELSKEVYQTCKSHITPKECYINVFNVLQFYGEKFKDDTWKIAYGYIHVLKDHPLMARHCFIVNEEGEVIDPTLPSLKHFNDQESKKYISFKIFEHLDDYLDSITHNNHKPDLIQPLLTVEQETAKPWAEENGYLLIV